MKSICIHFYFLKVLNKQVNEAGNNDGYSSRVKYLKKLNFESGTLKGMMEAVLDYWEHVDKGKDMSSNYNHYLYKYCHNLISQ